MYRSLPHLSLSCTGNLSNFQENMHSFSDDCSGKSSTAWIFVLFRILICTLENKIKF